MANAAVTAQQLADLHQAFLDGAKPFYGEPYATVNFGTAAQTSNQIRIPNAMLLSRSFLLVEGSATISIPATSTVDFTEEGLYALIPNVSQSVGLSAKPIDVSAYTLAQKLGMDYPAYQESENMNVTGTTFPYANTTGAPVSESFDFSFVVDAPNVYSEAGLQGLIMMQNQSVAGNFTISWSGTTAENAIFTATTGTNATFTALSATVTLASELYPVPNSIAQGAPDLTRYPILQETQYPLTGAKTIVSIDPGLEIMRVILHMYNGGVYDAANALQLQTIKWSWNGGAVSQIDTGVWVLNFLAQKRYANTVISQIGKGTYILDFDRQSPREWFNSTGVTDLKLQFTFGATPAANSYVNIALESMLDISGAM